MQYYQSLCFARKISHKFIIFKETRSVVNTRNILSDNEYGIIRFMMAYYRFTMPAVAYYLLNQESQEIWPPQNLAPLGAIFPTKYVPPFGNLAPSKHILYSLLL